MGHATDLHQSALTPQKNEMQLFFPAEPMAVRKALKASMAGLMHLNLTSDEKGVIEIVLAEVLNNVVEHAYANNKNGVVELQVKRMSDNLVFTVLDDGVPLQGDDVLKGPAPKLEGPVADLPEGGFGWFLIKELTQDLTYIRSNVRNKLNFTIALANTRVS